MVHKTLLHGRNIIKYNILPIGCLTEEASEARNKVFRRFRQNNARKCNRIATNQDILNMLLVSSDPLLSNNRPVLTEEDIDLPEEVNNVLITDEFNNRGDEIKDKD